MKHTHYLLLFLSLSLVLSGCSFDESLEATQQHDGDDIGVIQNIWPQALDQMLWWRVPPVVLPQASLQVPQPQHSRQVASLSSVSSSQPPHQIIPSAPILPPAVSSKVSEQWVQSALTPPILEGTHTTEND